MKKERKNRLWRDLLLILFLLALGLSLFFAMRASMPQGTKIVVMEGDSVILEHPLAVDGEFSLLGGKNRLCIKDGTAYMTESHCPDHLCEQQRAISLSGQRIVCLPHRLTVKVV